MCLVKMINGSAFRGTALTVPTLLQDIKIKKVVLEYK